MSQSSTSVRTIGDVHLWIEQEATVHIKAVSGSGDPVELTETELRELIDALTKFLSKIEG